MTSARRHRRFIAKKKSSRRPFLIFFFIIACLLALITFFKLNIKYWNGKEKVSIAISKPGGDVKVVLLDPTISEKIELTIPPNTEVEVAKNLGTFPIKNIVKLGDNEGVGGKLLPETITKSFLFPIVLWSDTEPDDIKILTTKNSNISFSDRVLIYFFTKTVKNLDITKIDMGRSQFLIKAKLTDGTLGYKLPDKISPRLLFYFAEQTFSGVKVYVKDATGKYGIGERVGEIVEVLGGKVVSLEKLTENQKDCSVTGTNTKAVIKVAQVFSCSVTNETTDYDLLIELGGGFAKRF